MATRTVHSTIAFNHPFILEGFVGTWPAGLYEIETDEEDLDSVSIQGRRRIRTIIYRRDPTHGTTEAVEVWPDVLDTAIRADAARSTAGTGGPSMDRPTQQASRVAQASMVTERWFTPVWVVPLGLGILILMGVLFGPFGTPGAEAGPGARSQGNAVPSATRLAAGP